MTLCDELLFAASVLRDGDCSAHRQIIVSHRLERIADDVKRLQEMADGIVGDAMSEDHLIRRRPQLRIVRS